MAHSHQAYRDHPHSHSRVAHILKDHPSGATKHHTGDAFSAVKSKHSAVAHDDKVTGSKGPKRYARGGKVKKRADGGQADNDQQSSMQNQASSMMSDQYKSQMDQLNKPTGQASDSKARGGRAYARGGKVKGKDKGHTTNVIVVPHHAPAGPQAGAAMAAPPPMAAPAPRPPMPMPPPGAGMPPGAGAPPPGMPMRARGGKVMDMSGSATAANLDKWSKRASGNSYHAPGKFRGGAATGVGRLEKSEHEKRK